MAVPPLDLNTARGRFRQHLRNVRQLSHIRHEFIPMVRDKALREAIDAAQTLGLYRPVGGEPDPLALIAGSTAQMALPALGDDERMIFRRWQRGDALVAAPWGGVQPHVKSEMIVPDVIFVPLLGFDLGFNRLGQGGGHYDRYLAAHPEARRIGVAWEVQRLDAIAVEPWDVPLDAIVTERECRVKDLHR